MKTNKKILFLLPLMFLASCQKKNADTTASAKPVETTSAIKQSDTTSSSKEDNQVEVNGKLTIDKYVADVAATAPIMVGGKDAGTDVDYIVSSYPVIFQAMQTNKSLKVVKNVAEDFSAKYGTEGFPQAGLFIKKSIAKDSTKTSAINAFLNTFDTDVRDLVNGGTETIKKINAYSTDVEVQKNRFNFTSGVIKNVQATNGLSFITKDKNPDAAGFAKFKDSLGIDIQSSQLSSFYNSDVSKSALTTSLDFKVVTPKGAPSAAFARYASDTEKLSLESPDNVKAQFSSAEAGFVVFDSVNGLKLSKNFGDTYELVRMVTFGNLYLVSTGHDSDNVISDSDYIVGYGENLIPDLAFKAVYSK